MSNTFAYVLSTSPSGRMETYFRLLVGRTFRKALTRLWDPLVEYELDGTKLLVPLSHDLPLNRRIFPQYNTALPRIASLMADKHPSMTIIDIGANIGDTVAVLRKTVKCPVLCIEGDERFLKVFKKNAPRFVDVELEASFVGPAGEGDGLGISSKGGTSHLEQSAGGGVSMQPLSMILQRRGEFAGSRLLKIDTDGFDTRIIRSELELLGRTKPAIFFEYDPYFLAKIGENGPAVFDALLGIGYRKALVFESWGDYLLTAAIDNRSLIEDLHAYYSGRDTLRYCDICVFHADDDDVATKARQVELEFAAATRR